jgi:hypothetical protein
LDGSTCEEEFAGFDDAPNPSELPMINLNTPKKKTTKIV